jgi:hypothetical protein
MSWPIWINISEADMTGQPPPVPIVIPLPWLIKGTIKPSRGICPSILYMHLSSVLHPRIRLRVAVDHINGLNYMWDACWITKMGGESVIENLIIFNHIMHVISM